MTCRETWIRPRRRSWPVRVWETVERWMGWLMSDAPVPCCYALCLLTLGYFVVMVGLAALKAGGAPWK